jgi:hypothetical protein
MKEKEKESTEQQLYVTALLFLRIKIRFVDSHLPHFALILIYALDRFLLKTIVLKENTTISLFIIFIIISKKKKIS